MSLWELLLRSWKALERVLREWWRPSLRDPVLRGLPDAGEPVGEADEELPGRWDENQESIMFWKPREDRVVGSKWSGVLNVAQSSTTKTEK